MILYVLHFHGVFYLSHQNIILQKLTLLFTYPQTHFDVLDYFQRLIT